MHHLTKKGDGMMCLLSEAFSLLFLSQFFRKGRKALVCCLSEVVFMAEIKIISQPFEIIPMLSSLHTSLIKKRSVLAGKIGWNLNHVGVSDSWLSILNE